MLKRSKLRDSRWTIADKILQYKGLVRLHERDAKILQADKRVTERKNKRCITELKKEIDENRSDLIKAIKCDPQVTRNVMLERRDVILAFQNHLPEKTIDYLNHNNFIKRKKLDRLRYGMKQKADALVGLKLQAASLEDKITCGDSNEIPGRRECQVISGKVQEATIKQEAALATQKIYKQIIDILNRDRLFYDCVLDKLRRDLKQQCRCLQDAITSGQLATEYADDSKQELDVLKRAVKADARTRLEQLVKIRKRVAFSEAKFKAKIRGDHDVTLMPLVSDLSDPGERGVKTDLEMLLEIFKVLQECMLVPNFESIFPCIQEQRNAYVKMVNIMKRHCKDKKKLENKIKHVRIARSNVEFRVDEQTFNYMEAKKLLANEAKAAQQQVEIKKVIVEQKSNTLVTIRAALVRVLKILSVVTSPNEIKPTQAISRKGDSGVVALPEVIDNNCDRILELLKIKLAILAAGFYGSKNEIETSSLDKIEMFKNYEEHAAKTCVKITKPPTPESGWAFDLEFTDPHVKTNAMIKAESEQIVEQNQKSET